MTRARLHAREASTTSSSRRVRSSARPGPRRSAVHQDDALLLAALNGDLSGMRQARHSLMFKYLSEEALTLFAQARRE